MQEYPVRSIVSEPFVNQIEVIEKTLIEVRNQPSSYYGRRNRVQQQQPLAQQMSQTGSHSGGAATSGQYYKYGNFYPVQQQQEYYGYHQGINREFKTGGGSNSGNMNMGNLGNNTPGSSTFGSSAHSNGSSGSVNMDSGISSVGSLGLGGAPTHVPQVFDDNSVGQDSRGFATFDPFESKDYGKGGMFQPMFNSSNNILGSGFSGNSNIWGNTNKTMASDAAVWG